MLDDGQSWKWVSQGVSTARSTDTYCVMTSNRFDDVFKLAVHPLPSFAPIELDQFVRFHRRSFQHQPVPCVVRSCGHRQSKSIADFDGSCGKETTSRFLSDDCGEPVLSCKRDNHFRGARGVAVHQENDAPVKWFLSQPLGLKHNGLLPHHCRPKLQDKPPQGLG